MVPAIASEASRNIENVETRLYPLRTALLIPSDARYVWYGTNVPGPSAVSPFETFLHASKSVEI